jgi:hypothetical protein
LVGRQSVNRHGKRHQGCSKVLLEQLNQP